MPERYGAVPKVAIAKEELEGNWELIQMKPTAKNSTNDGNATQYESNVITLGADGNVTSEAWGNDQTWSFAAAKNMITIGMPKTVPTMVTLPNTNPTSSLWVPTVT